MALPAAAASFVVGQVDYDTFGVTFHLLDPDGSSVPLGKEVSTITFRAAGDTCSRFPVPGSIVRISLEEVQE